jgi:hypothetical protein
LQLEPGQVLHIGDVDIAGFESTDFGALERCVEGLIPGGATAIGRDWVGGECQVLLITPAMANRSESLPGESAYLRASSASRRKLDMCLTALRLISNASAEDLFQLDGQTGFVRTYPLRLETFRHSDMSLTYRVHRITRGQIRGLKRLIEVVQTALAAGTEDEIPSITFALQRFNRSFQPTNPSDRLADLAIALEAALGSEDRNEVTLRLRSRAAALLATRQDTSSEIFDDVGLLYELRSGVVHGASQKVKRLGSRLAKISAAQRSRYAGIQTLLAIDRARDLVRRAILCRLMLSRGNQPTWPILLPSNQGDGMDRRIAADSERLRLRRQWRGELRGIGLATAADEASRLSTIDDG